MKKNLIKDLVPPILENVTEPLKWAGPKKLTPDWKKCVALNTRVKEGSDEVLKRFLCFENEIDDAAKKAIIDKANDAAHKAKIADVDPKDVKP